MPITIGLACQTVLPKMLFRQLVALLPIKLARAIHRAISRDAVLQTHDVIFVAMAGRRMDRAGALLERDVIAQNAERRAVQKRMLEHARLPGCEPGKVASTSSPSQPQRSAVAGQQIFAQRCTRLPLPSAPRRIRTSGGTRSRD